MSENPTEMLKCEFTKEEVQELGSKLARKHLEIVDLKNQKAAVTSRYGGSIKIAETEAASLSEKIRNGYEFRDVEYRKQMLPETAEVAFIRLDTGEIYRTRNMTEDERQANLFEEHEGK